MVPAPLVDACSRKPRALHSSLAGAGTEQQPIGVCAAHTSLSVVGRDTCIAHAHWASYMRFGSVSTDLWWGDDCGAGAGQSGGGDLVLHVTWQLRTRLVGRVGPILRSDGWSESRSGRSAGRPRIKDA